jgi:hypothetical protein
VGAEKVSFLDRKRRLVLGASGKPPQADPLGSYEEWSDLVRSTLMWLGEADLIWKTLLTDICRNQSPTILKRQKVFLPSFVFRPERPFVPLFRKAPVTPVTFL